MPGPRRKNKSVSMFSHEFITTNHGDIISCVCMLFMVGLMFKVLYNMDYSNYNLLHFRIAKKQFRTFHLNFSLCLRSLRRRKSLLEHSSRRSTTLPKPATVCKSCIYLNKSVVEVIIIV